MSSETVKSANGEEVTSGKIGTGFTVTKGEKTYSVVIKGDTDGDGSITANDYLVVKAHFKNKTALSGAYLNAADVTNTGRITVSDYIGIKRGMTA